MKRQILYVAIGVITFLTSLGFATYFVFSPSYDLETSSNVCQKCLDVAKTENLESKTVSGLVNDKDTFGNKIYLRARFIHDAGYVSLQDLENKAVSIRAGFDKNAIPCSDTEKTLQVCTGYKTWYDGSVDVTVIGYLGKIDKETNKFQGGEDGFNIICVMQVNPTDEEIKRGKTAFENNPFSLSGILFH